jgi:hypothetical protein
MTGMSVLPPRSDRTEAMYPMYNTSSVSAGESLPLDFTVSSRYRTSWAFLALATLALTVALSSPTGPDKSAGAACRTGKRRSILSSRGPPSFFQYRRISSAEHRQIPEVSPDSRRARIAGQHKHESGRITDGTIRTGYGNPAIFYRFPHCLQDIGPEFWRLIKEKDTGMSQADLTWFP